MILGKGKSGKTTLWRWLAHELKKKDFVNFGIDPHNKGGEEFDFLLRPTKHEGERRNKITNEEVKTFIECIPENHTKGVFLFVDEISKWLRPNSGVNELRDLIESGRNENIGIVGTVRKSHYVRPELRESYDLLFSFQIRDPDERQYMSKWLNYDCGPLKKLKRRKFWSFD